MTAYNSERYGNMLLSYFFQVKFIFYILLCSVSPNIICTILFSGPLLNFYVKSHSYFNFNHLGLSLTDRKRNVIHKEFTSRLLMMESKVLIGCYFSLNWFYISIFSHYRASKRRSSYLSIR